MTDDSKWVRDHSFFWMIQILSSGQGDPEFDVAIRVLSICTFGWWGAFLDDRSYDSTSAVMYPAGGKIGAGVQE